MPDAHHKPRNTLPELHDEARRAREPDPGDEAPVGYGRPPVHTRFKPGQSGNRRGRPKGAKSAEATLQSLLRQKVAIQDAAGRRKVSALEALLRSLMQRALRGDNRAAKLLLEVQQRLPASDAPAGATPSMEEDQAIVAAFLAKRQDMEAGDAGRRGDAASEREADQSQPPAADVDPRADEADGD